MIMQGGIIQLKATSRHERVCAELNKLKERIEHSGRAVGEAWLSSNELPHLIRRGISPKRQVTACENVVGPPCKSMPVQLRSTLDPGGHLFLERSI